MNGYSEHVLWGCCKKHIFVHALACIIFIKKGGIYITTEEAQY